MYEVVERHVRVNEGEAAQGGPAGDVHPQRQVAGGADALVAAAVAAVVVLVLVHFHHSLHLKHTIHGSELEVIFY